MGARLGGSREQIAGGQITNPRLRSQLWLIDQRAGPNFGCLLSTPTAGWCVNLAHGRLVFAGFPGADPESPVGLVHTGTILRSRRRTWLSGRASPCQGEVAGSNPVVRSKWSSQVAGGRVHKIAVNTAFSMLFVPREPVGGLGVPAEARPGRGRRRVLPVFSDDAPRRD